MIFSYVFPGVKMICRFRQIIFFAVGCLLFPAVLQAQTYYFDNYGVAEGLSSSKVYTVIQDREDYIWLGTEAGLSRFDGVSFQNFTPENGLAEGGVYSMMQDSRGLIWLGHLDGRLSRYDGEKFEVIPFPSGEIRGDITSILEDASGKIWITTQGAGAFRLENPEAVPDEISSHHFIGGDLSDQVFASLKTRNNDIYMLTDQGVRVFNPDSSRFEALHIENLPRYFMIITIFEDSEGNLWFGTYNGGLYHYSKKTGDVTIYDSVRDGLAKNWVSCITEDSRGRMWIGTWGGGISLLENGSFRNFDQTNGLQDLNIKCLVEDHEGNMLIGTYDHGLSVFKGDHFVTFTENDGLSNPIVWAIHQDRTGKYWFGTNGGITVYDPEAPSGRQFTYYNQDNRYIENKIRFLREDRHGNIWIGTEGGGLIRYEPSGKRFINDIYLNERLYRDQIITALEIDEHNNLWIGTNEGLGYFEPTNGYVERVTQSGGLAGNLISSLYYDSRGNLWIGSQVTGLTRCVKEGDQYVFTIMSMPRNFTPVSMTEDADGNIWIGTEKGVYVFNGDTIIRHLTENDGLLANNVNLVDHDREWNMYIGTNKGLNKYVPEKDKIYTYSRKSGFVGIETKENASFCDSNGRMWFGTVAGVTRYDPHRVADTETEPLTHIRAMQINYQPASLIPGQKLSYRQKNIVFDYNSICLKNPDAVRYKVMLEGADDDWRPSTTQTRAIYPALSPGKYTFKVIARNSTGKWNTEPVTYSFIIRPPFYQTWWFILICVVAGITAILSYIRIREQQLKRENRILEEKVAERTAEVVQKSKELEEKNKNITDSIRYAKRIQNAMLPTQESFTETFILFKPKDIVSGDFYWLARTEHKQLIAAVDCTGHGVPGAFMSIIGHNSLNKIVKEYHMDEPAAILEKLNRELILTLHQQNEDEEVKDGMDIALISIDIKTRELQFAGAYNPLYHFRNGELTEIKGDRTAIGRTSLSRPHSFTNHSLMLEKGDVVYIFSDGYADQFGGPQGKKFKYSALKNLLREIKDKPMEEQKFILDETLEKWRGNLEQVDDVLIIGSRIN